LTNLKKMHFKNPEILFALFTLLIPILIHLFQLQRFVKVPFTNVKFLKEIELQTRKSSKLKKLLILLSRMATLAALIIAFAQPYFSKSDTSKKWETIFYIDNSLSMSAKGAQGELLKRVSQEIIENLPSKGSFSLLTNDQFITDLDQNDLKETLLQIDYAAQNSDVNSLILKTEQYFKRSSEINYKFLWISDFQKSSENELPPVFKDLPLDIVVLKPVLNKNLSIDSVFVSENATDYKVLTVQLTNQGNKAENVNLSAYQNKMLLAKTNVNITENGTFETTIRVSEDLSKVKLQLDYEDAFLFDNVYYLAFQKIQKIPVLVISDGVSFLNKIFTEDEFILTEKPIQQISFESIEKNQLIVLNEVKEIPENLVSKFEEFTQKGGSLTIIPHPENSIEQLNSLLNLLKIGAVSKVSKDSLQITKIHFSHPLLKHVFEKEVSNFQYPTVNTVFENTSHLGQSILSFANQRPFISQYSVGEGNVYWIASPLDKNSSNFVQSPLVVPVFYNMAKMSGLQNQLSYRIGQINQIMIPFTLQKDEVLTLTQGQEKVIPTQEIHTDFVVLITDEQPHKSGFYTVQHQGNDIQVLAFNDPKEESNVACWKPNQLIENQKNIKNFNHIKDALSSLSDAQNILSYFKWFVALALLFVIIEILLLKYF